MRLRGGDVNGLAAIIDEAGRLSIVSQVRRSHRIGLRPVSRGALGTSSSFVALCHAGSTPTSRERLLVRSSRPMIDQAQRSDASKSEAGLEEARLRQQAIGVKLRQMFDEIVNEPVPDDFLEILRRADGKGAKDEGTEG